MFTCFITAYAAGGSGGDGSGGGGGKLESLAVTGVSVVNGQLAPDDVITLTFNKNVVNAAISENNKAAFALYDSNGGIVPINVIMADEQINPERKTIISVKPASSLLPGAAYTLVVSENMTAKSGAGLAGGYKLEFTVTGTATTAATAATTQADDTVQVSAPVAPAAQVVPAAPVEPDEVSTAPEPAIPLSLEADAAAESPALSAPVLPTSIDEKPADVPPTSPDTANPPGARADKTTTVIFICAGLAVCALAVIFYLKGRTKS